jgi:hypothetical protein
VILADRVDGLERPITFDRQPEETWEPGDFNVVYRRVIGSLEDHPQCMVNDSGTSIWATATAIPLNLIEIEFPSFLRQSAPRSQGLST